VEEVKTARILMKNGYERKPKGMTDLEWLDAAHRFAVTGGSGCQWVTL